MIDLLKSADPRITQALFLGAMLVVFYFFSIRPQRKKHQGQQHFMKSLKPGVHVVTIGGLHGKIMKVDTTTLTLEIDHRAQLVVEKSAISAEASRRYQQKKV